MLVMVWWWLRTMTKRRKKIYVKMPPPSPLSLFFLYCIHWKNITELFDNIPWGMNGRSCINQISISFFPRRQTFLFSNNFIAYLLHHHRKQKQTERIQNNTQNDSCVPVYSHRIACVWARALSQRFWRILFFSRSVDFN